MKIWCFSTRKAIFKAKSHCSPCNTGVSSYLFHSISRIFNNQSMAQICPRVFVFCLLLQAGPLLRASEQPIELNTPTGVIRGTLAAPDVVSTWPVVLIVAGSGPTNRDGNTATSAGSRNDSLKLLADALAAQGFASVRFDKRGVGESAGPSRNEAELRLEHYVEDVASWIEFLSEDRRFSGIAVLGHSEGSLIGMLAAQRRAVSAFVSVAGPSEKASSILRRQLRGLLPPDLAERNEAILSSLEAGQFATDVPPQLAVLYRPSVQPYLMSWFKYIPTDEIAKLDLPCLVVQGRTDIQVDVSDAEALHAANGRCQLAVVDGMNHLLKIVSADRAQQSASYGNPSLPVAPELIRVLDGFLRSVKFGH
jgi:uncharacterized protein